jgi:hypothetical protein
LSIPESVQSATDAIENFINLKEEKWQ